MKGRPPKLQIHEQVLIQQALQNSPKDYGYQYSYWCDKVLRAFINRQFGVLYHLGHVRRLRKNLVGSGWRYIQTIY
jgi:transposase